MLSDFNKAQDLLKGKINEITNERDDFEQKYLNRDSRPEDTEMIDHLNVSRCRETRESARIGGLIFILAGDKGKRSNCSSNGRRYEILSTRIG